MLKLRYSVASKTLDGIKLVSISTVLILTFKFGYSLSVTKTENTHRFNIVDNQVRYSNLNCENHGVKPEQDYDCDGVINAIDIDDDNDGVLDEVECQEVQYVFTYSKADSDSNKIVFTSNVNGAIEQLSITKLVDNSYLLNPLGISEKNELSFVLNQNDAGVIMEDKINTEAAIKIESTIPLNSINFDDLDNMDRFKNDNPTDGIAFSRPGTWKINSGDLAAYDINTQQLTVNNTNNDAEDSLNSLASNSTSEELKDKGLVSDVLVRGTVGGETNNASATFYSATPFLDIIMGIEDMSLLGKRENIKLEFIFGTITASIRDCDDDKDGIFNDFDLDSDGDNCPDSIESGIVIFNSDVLVSGTVINKDPSGDTTLSQIKSQAQVNINNGGDINGNGFHDSLEDNNVPGTYAGNYTYENAVDNSNSLGCCQFENHTSTIELKNNTNCIPGSENGSITILNSGFFNGQNYNIDFEFIPDGAQNLITKSALVKASNHTLILDKLAGGTYQNVVIESGTLTECTLEVENFKIEDPKIQATATTTNVSCFGGNDGSIVLNVNDLSADASYIWSNGATTKDINNLTAGTYSVIITDDFGCSGDSIEVSITEPEALELRELTSSQQAVRCYGASDGGFTVEASGGYLALSETYRYSLEDGSQSNTTGVFTALQAGAYAVRVTDSNQCQKTLTVTIKSADVVALTELKSDHVNVSCFSESTGGFRVQASGGSGVYQYSLNDSEFSQPQDTGHYTNLSAGSYTVYVRDSNGCSGDSIEVSITEPEALELRELTSSQQAVRCYGASDGGFTVEASGGYLALSETYRYSLEDGSQSNTTGVFTALQAGAYAVRVTDSNQCQTTLTVTIKSADVVALTELKSDHVNVSCFSESTGGFRVQASGGSGVYQYSLNDSEFSQPQDTGHYTNLRAGRYTVYVRDSNGCSGDSIEVSITEPEALELRELTSSQQAVRCYGASDGGFTVEASGGYLALSETYRYSLEDGSQSNTTGVFTALQAGAYAVRVTDSNQCQTTLTVTIKSADVVALTELKSDHVNVSCFSESTGGFRVQASGGSGVYQYSLNDSEFSQPQDTGHYTNLSAGSYTVYVRDSNGCSGDSIEVSITEPEALELRELTSSQQAVRCYGASDGGFTVEASGGYLALSETYRYSLEDGSQSNTTGVFTALQAGVYAVRVTDSNQCQTTLTVTIKSADVVALTELKSDHVNVSCFSESTGGFRVQASGGSGVYQYSLNDSEFSQPQDTGHYTNLRAGRYTVYVRDSNGCSGDSIEVSITEPEALELRELTSSQQAVRCYGASDGGFTVEASGGYLALSETYRYSLEDGSQSNTTGVFTALQAGAYAVRVTDSNQCQTTLTVTIKSADVVALTELKSDHVNVSCFSESTGGFRVQASGGSGVYQYSLNDSEFSQPQDTGHYTNLSAGSYTVYVRDSNGCSGDSIEVSITEPEALELRELTSSQQAVRCYGASDGGFTLEASGGYLALSETYRYSLEDGSQSNTTGVFTALQAGVYAVRVTDSNQCQTTLTVTIKSADVVALTELKSDHVNVSCFSESTASFRVQASGGSGVYQYSLNDSEFSQPQDTGHYTNLSAGSYTVYVRDSNGCSGDSIEVSITEPEALELRELTSSQQAVRCYGASDGGFTVEASGGYLALSETYRYSLEDGSQSNTTGVFTGLQAGAYAVRVTDSNQCQTTLTVTIKSADVVALTELKSDHVNVSCFSESTGGFRVQASGGSGVYQYSLNDSGFSQPQDTGHYTNLTAGSYTVYVRDSNGCSGGSIEVVIKSNCTYAIVDINNTYKNIEVRGNVLTNDLDYENDKQYVVSPSTLESVKGGVVKIETNGNYSFTPPLNYSGEDWFEYEICDDGNPIACSISKVLINILDNESLQNKAPIANPDTATTLINKKVNGTILTNDFDQDGDNISISNLEISTLKGGELELNADGSFTYLPPRNFTGIDIFEYEICDDNKTKLCAKAIVTITVVDLNKANVNTTNANDDAYNIIFGDDLNKDVSLNDFDLEGDKQKFSIVSNPSHGDLVLNEDGTFRYISNTNEFINSDQFIYQACDSNSNSACDKATVYITFKENYCQDLEVVLKSNFISCKGCDDGIIEADIIGGSGDYTLSWTGPNQFLTASDSGKNSIQINREGLYQVVVLDNNTKCKKTQTIVIELANPELQLIKNVSSGGNMVGDIIYYDLIIKNTGNVVIEAIEVSDPLADYLSHDHLEQLNSGEEIIIEATYTITQNDINIGYVENTAEALGYSPDAKSDIFVVSDSGTDTDGSYVTQPLTVETQGAEGFIDFDPTNDPTLYYIQQGRKSDVIVYNEFSPNGDGYNDFFEIDNIEFYPNNKLSVFNRWGVLVFTISNYDNTWDGSNRKNNSATKLPTGTYFYTLELNDLYKTKLSGWVYINR